MKTRQIAFVLVLLFITICACNLPLRPDAISPGALSSPVVLSTTQAGLAPTRIDTSSPEPAPSVTPSLTPSLTPVSTTTPTATPDPTPAFTNTPIPTYQKLRGEVIVDNVVCHFGPGAPYLYKYGLVAGSHLEVIGRIAQGKYIQVQAIGGNNPCWVNPDWMKVNGDLAVLPPVSPDDTGLPFSRRYKPPAGVSARRDGHSVIIFWAPVVLSLGDTSTAPPYLIEAWVCQAGQIVFSPTGWLQTSAVIEDEPGCAAPSHARLYAVEKHGYTLWIEIPWPVNP
jgi:hypothetical protein